MGVSAEPVFPARRAQHGGIVVLERVVRGDPVGGRGVPAFDHIVELGVVADVVRVLDLVVSVVVAVVAVVVEVVAVVVTFVVAAAEVGGGSWGWGL